MKISAGLFRINCVHFKRRVYLEKNTSKIERKKNTHNIDNNKRLQKIMLDANKKN
jgi:hypothetical protein